MKIELKVKRISEPIELKMKSRWINIDNNKDSIECKIKRIE